MSERGGYVDDEAIARGIAAKEVRHRAESARTMANVTVDPFASDNANLALRLERIAAEIEASERAEKLLEEAASLLRYIEDADGWRLSKDVSVDLTDWLARYSEARKP